MSELFNKKLNLRRELLLIALLLAAVILPFFMQTEAKAETADFTVTASCDSDYVYSYNGEWYISAGSNGNVKMNYTLRNNTDKAIKFSAIKVEETMLDDYENYKYGTEVYDSKVITIGAGEEIKLSGSTFNCKGSSNYTFLYDILAVPYQTDGYGMALPFSDEDYQSIIGDGNVLFISSERMQISVDYDFKAYKDNIFVGDTITLTTTVSSLCNVPLQNINVYDSAYGFLGTISSLSPGESIRFSTNVTAKGDTDSYVFLEYSVSNRTQRDVKEFPDSRIEIQITEFTYELELEVTPTTWYISDGEILNFEVELRNIGTGKVDNIIVFGLDDTQLFSVSSLAAGTSYSASASFTCSPSVNYTFRAISPQLEEDVLFNIELLLVPDVSVSCTIDRKPTEYEFLDYAEITYTVRNNGSIDALDVILIDVGIDQRWEIGPVYEGMKKTVKYTLLLANEKNVLSPTLTGIYDDGNETPFESVGTTTIIEVQLPNKYIDIRFEPTYSRQIINEGDDVTFNFKITNLGNGNFKNYTVRLVELNMVIGTEGLLGPNDTKTFTTTLKMTLGQKITVRVLGKNADTGEDFSADYELPITVHELLVKPTVTPSASSTPLPTQDPSKKPDVIDDKEALQSLLKLATYVVGAIVAIIAVVSLVMVISISIKVHNKKKKLMK